MKKLILILAFIFMVVPAKAVEVWLSSNTTTSDGTYAKLCDKRAVFHGVCTNFGVAAASTTVVNSSFTVANVKQIGPISTFVADQCKYYDAAFTNGLGYQKTNTASVTYLYFCY